MFKPKSVKTTKPKNNPKQSPNGIKIKSAAKQASQNKMQSRQNPTTAASCCKTTPLSHNLLTKNTRSSVQSKRLPKPCQRNGLVVSNVPKTSKLKNASSSLSSQVQKLKASAQTCKVKTSSHNAAPIATSQHQIATQQCQIFTSFPVAGFLRWPLRGKNK